MIATCLKKASHLVELLAFTPATPAKKTLEALRRGDGHRRVGLAARAEPGACQDNHLWIKKRNSGEIERNDPRTFLSNLDELLCKRPVDVDTFDSRPPEQALRFGGLGVSL
jgi:hypothetical protein